MWNDTALRDDVENEVCWKLSAGLTQISVTVKRGAPLNWPGTSTASGKCAAERAAWCVAHVAAFCRVDKKHAAPASLAVYNSAPFIRGESLV
jgi:hypothetical protein